MADRSVTKHCPYCDGNGHPPGTLGRCEKCFGTGLFMVQCSTCQHWKFVLDFLGTTGRPGKNCRGCNVKMERLAQVDVAQRLNGGSPRRNLKSDGPNIRVFFSARSTTRKTGPIPVSMTSANTCPPSCSYYDKGCYAETHGLAITWRRLSNGTEGLNWAQFLSLVRSLPAGQTWKHNEAGDLPGYGEELDRDMAMGLARAAEHTRGFTLTHKQDFEGLRELNAHGGLVVNLSADNLDHADELSGEGLPLTVVLPHDAYFKNIRTRKGRVVVVCPAQRSESISCATCQLCAVGRRKSIVGFLAMGDRRKEISERLTGQLKLPMFRGA